MDGCRLELTETNRLTLTKITILYIFLVVTLTSLEVETSYLVVTCNMEISLLITMWKFGCS